MDDGTPPALPDATESFLADMFDSLHNPMQSTNDDGMMLFEATTTNSQFITAGSEFKPLVTTVMKQEHHNTPKQAPRGSRSKLIMAAIKSRSPAEKKENVNPNPLIAVAREPTKSNVMMPARHSVENVDRMAAALNLKELRALATLNNKPEASEEEEEKKKERATEKIATDPLALLEDKENVASMEDKKVAAKVAKKPAPHKSSRPSKASRPPKKRSVDSKKTSNDAGATARRNKKMWTEQEDEKLRQLIAKEEKITKKDGDLRWTNVANAMGGGRTSKQCRERFANHLRSDLVKGNWSASEDKLLFQLQAIHGNSWATIRKHGFHHRSDNDIKNRWYSHQRSEKRARASGGEGEDEQGPKKRKKKKKQQPKPVASVANIATAEAHKSPPEEPTGHDPNLTALFPALAAGRTPKDLFDNLDLSHPAPFALEDVHGMGAAFLLAAQTPGNHQPLVQTPSEQSHVPSSGVLSNFKWTPGDSVVEFVPL